MRFPKSFHNRSVRIVLISIILLSIIYVALRLVLFENDPILPFLNNMYYKYLLIPESIANYLFGLFEAKVQISNHRLIFENQAAYHIAYEKFLSNWSEYLSYKKWVALMLLLIWCKYSSFRKKALFSVLLAFTHLMSVIGGLLLLGIIGPRNIDEHTEFFLSPTLSGTFFFYIFILIWVLYSKNDIRRTISKIGLNLTISDRKLKEFLVLFFLFLVLKNYLIPFFAFKPYVLFLLEVSKYFAGLFGHEGYIIGDQLVGATGALALSKHCLGFMTMYIFASLIYLTRPDNKRLVTIKFITIGTVVIFIANLLRLILVFVVAQGENGYSKANLHHEIYNIAIYILIFLLWVLWFELILRKRKFFK